MFFVLIIYCFFRRIFSFVFFLSSFFDNRVHCSSSSSAIDTTSCSSCSSIFSSIFSSGNVSSTSSRAADTRLDGVVSIAVSCFASSASTLPIISSDKRFCPATASST
uniref:Candidate secreted effector n=1 Tax=Meloidogyne incognita TaxID=6306 RepID=A0A914M9F8_MELIC